MRGQLILIQPTMQQRADQIDSGTGNEQQPSFFELAGEFAQQKDTEGGISDFETFAAQYSSTPLPGVADEPGETEDLATQFRERTGQTLSLNNMMAFVQADEDEADGEGGALLSIPTQQPTEAELSADEASEVNRLNAIAVGTFQTNHETVLAGALSNPEMEFRRICFLAAEKASGSGFSVTVRDPQTGKSWSVNQFGDKTSVEN